MNEKQTIKLFARTIPAGTSKNGNHYDAFTAFKTLAQDGKYYDVRFTKYCKHDDIDADVANGVTEFDVTGEIFKTEPNDKYKFACYFVKSIERVVKYTTKAPQNEQLPF